MFASAASFAENRLTTSHDFLMINRDDYLKWLKDIKDKIIIGSSIWVPVFVSVYDDGQLYHSACKLWNIWFL